MSTENDLKEIVDKVNQNRMAFEKTVNQARQQIDQMVKGMSSSQDTSLYATLTEFFVMGFFLRQKVVQLESRKADLSRLF